MGLYINTNVSSLVARKHFGRTQEAMNQSMVRLSTGMRINRAADDAAGLAISEGLKAEIRSMGQARRNANDGISLLQTAEGALEQVGTNLVRMRELAVQAANGTINSDQRMSVHGEFAALMTEIDRISRTSNFSDIPLLTNPDESIDFQVGIDGDADSRITVTLQDSQTTAIGESGGAYLNTQSISTIAEARVSLSHLDTAIADVSAMRAEIGARHNQLASAMANLETTIENLSAANSRIREVDFASETAELTRTQILMQAGVAILAQANTSPQYALSLLG